MKKKTFPPQILNNFRPYFLENQSCWVIQLSGNQFLHWVDSQDLHPCTVDRPEFAMQKYDFKLQAEAMIKYLQILWSEIPHSEWNSNAPIKVTIDTEQELQFRKDFVNEKV